MSTEIVDIEEVKELLFAYATGDYQKRAIISDKRDERDTILGAINMLGEELEDTTVSRDYFSSIYNAVAEMLFLIKVDGSICECNNAIERELDFEPGELVGNRLSSVMADVTNINKLFEGEGLDYVTLESKLKTKGNHSIPVSVTISRIPDDVEERLLVIAKNISEQKKTEQIILQTIIDTEEKERKRLAFDLHDSLGQEINAVKMYLNVASYGTVDEETKRNIEQCKSMLEGSIDSIRKIVFDLLPASLDKGNLDLAVKQLVDSLRGIYDTDFDYKITGNAKSIDKRTEIMVYRIIQEFVNNSLKYAEADIISIGLDFEESELKLYLQDNGKGFNMDELEGSGNGLKNMTSRVRAVDGELEFFSELEKGTQLSATFKIG